MSHHNHNGTDHPKYEEPTPTSPVDYVQGFAAPLDQFTFPDAFMPTEVLLESLEKEEEEQK